MCAYNTKECTATFTVTVSSGAPTFSNTGAITKTYGNAAFKIPTTVNSGGKLSYSSSNTGVATVDASGNVTIKAAGTTNITVSAAATSNYTAGSVVVKLTVNKASPTFSGSTSFTKTWGVAAFSLGQSVNSGGTLSYSSNNTGVATVNSSGTVTIVGKGTATITVAAAATSNYNAGSRYVTVTVNPKAPTFSGETAFSVTYGGTVNIKDSVSVDSGGALSFASSNTNILTVNAATGVVTPVAQGTANVTVTAAANGNYASGTRTVTVTVSRAQGSITAEKYEMQRIPGDVFNVQDIIDEAGIKAVTNGALKFESSNTDLVSIASDGTVTAADASGMVEINVSTEETNQYTAAAIDKKIQLLVGKTAPGAPSFTATSGENKKITITWTPPAFTGGDPVTGYYILRTHTDADGNEINKTYEVGLVVDTYVDRDVENGVTYTYKMKARNSIGTGKETEPKTAKPYTVPNAPKNFTGEGESNTSIRLSWAAPDYDGGDSITSYRVRVYSDYLYQNEITNANNIKISQESGGAFNAEVTGLNKATMYYLTVEGVNGAVKGDVSAAVSRVECRTWSPPSAPRYLKVRAENKTDVNVMWDEPSDIGGTPITSYTLYYRDHTEDNSEAWTVVNGITEKNRIVTGLELGKYYDFKVKAVNASDANGGAETDILVGTPASAPGKPTIGKLISSNNSVIIDTAVCEDIGGDDIIEYRAYYRSPGSGEFTDYAVIKEIVDNGLKGAVIPGLRNGEIYEIAISAVNNYGESEKTEAQTIKVGLPSTPENMKIVPLTGQQVQVSYSESKANGSEPVTYDLYFGGTYQGMPITTPAHFTTKDTKYVFDAGERLNGDKITVYVIASNAAGQSTPTETLSTTVGEPGAPTLLSLATDSNGISLEWSASEPHGNAIVRYNVHIKGSDGTDEVLRHSDLSSLKKTITKEDFAFKEGVKYTVTVTCTNSSDINGEGQPSNAEVFTFGAPDLPEITETDMSSRTLKVSWNKPQENGGSEITGYKLYLNDETDATMLVDWEKPEGSDKYQLYITDYRSNTGRVTYGEGQETLDSFTVEIGGLANGSSYSVRVSALNENGEGRDETLKEPVVPADKAGAPRDVVCEPLSGTSGRISWNKPYNNGGAAVTDYSVELYKTGENYNGGKYEDVVSETASKIITTTKGEQTIEADGLEPGCRYEVRVTPINIAGNGEAGIGELKTHAKPGKAVITELASGVGESATLPLKVAWTAPKDDGGSKIIGYDIYVNGAYCMNIDGMLPADAAEYTINDIRLENGTNYEITVVTYNEVTGRVYSSGTSSDSKSVTIGTIPAPKNVKATCSTNGDVVVSWPLDQYGEEVTKYIDRFLIYQNGINVATVSKTTDTKKLTLRPMGTPLTMQVAVLSTFGQLGNLSNPITLIIGAPESVTNVTAEPRENGAYVSWTPVEMPVGFEVTGYNIYVDGSETPALTAAADAESAVVEGLTGGREYSVTVAAVNENGAGQTELEGIQSEPVSVIPYAKPD